MARRNTSAARTTKKRASKGRGANSTKTPGGDSGGPGPVEEFAVSFNGWSTDKRATSIGLSTRIRRTDLSLSKADKLFCGSRVTGTAMAILEDIDPDQKQLPTMEDDAGPKIENTFDCTKFGVSPDYITVTLRIPIVDGLDLNEIGQFNGRNGVLRVDSAVSIPRPEKNRGATAEPATVSD